MDKQSQDRGTPRPNSHDVLPQRPNHGTISTQYQTSPQSATNGFVKMQNQSLLANDGTTNRGIFGYNKALEQWGIFVTTPGTDVTTNTNLSNFLLYSGGASLTITETGNVALNSPRVTVNAGSINTTYVTYDFTQTYSTAPLVIPVYSGLGGIFPVGTTASVGSQVVVAPLITYGYGYGVGGVDLNQIAVAASTVSTTSASITITFVNGTGSSWEPGTIDLTLNVLAEVNP